MSKADDRANALKKIEDLLAGRSGGFAETDDDMLVEMVGQAVLSHASKGLWEQIEAAYAGFTSAIAAGTDVYEAEEQFRQVVGRLLGLG